ncbi:MAG TPA: ABC-type transport auxiliary lipoprotein family protein [Verrucomicrobiota bacterium]|nr:ABC-type transport auxiliary lipoprotein family protein [Verrucomicrobiota bacterium]
MTPSQTRSPAARSIGLAASAIAIVLAVACAGCLSKPALKRQTFAFDNPAATASATATGDVLAIRSVMVSALFNEHAFTYRTGDLSYETDPYAGFLIAPGQAVAIASRALLLNSGRFKDVVEPGSHTKPDRIIEIYVTELYGDFSKHGQPAAVLSLRVSLFEPGVGRDRQSVMHKDYSRRIEISQNTASAVMTGWNTALTQIMADVAAQLSAAK